MDGIFKQKLLSLRNPAPAKSFADALFPDSSWARSAIPKKQEKLPSKEAFSEKVQVIESFERFAQEKVSATQSGTLKIAGGEVVVRAEPSWEEVGHSDSLSSLWNELKLEEKLKELVLKEKHPGTVKALFVSEKFRTWEEIEPELKSGFINELLAGFPLKTAELFERMILAMKLTAPEVVILPVEGSDETDFARDVMAVAACLKPEIIITLGAKAISKILKSNDRLSLVHGQFFSRKIGASSFQVVPLFHPSIIETNQNMKKTAWADMQKIMKHLKKLP
ncbi:MAG: uracil-DNA glycosylase family protein [Bacteriovoracia bacterium]